MKSHYVAAISGGGAGLIPRILAIFTLVSTIGLVTAAAEAQKPASSPPGGSESMLQSARRNVANSLHSLLPRASTPRGCLDGIKRLSEERRTAQRVIAAEYPLDDMTGILLADSYDQFFVAAVDTLTQSFLAGDKDLPSSQAGEYFTGQLSDLPPVNDTPAAFIVAFVIMRCVQVAQAPAATLPPEVREDVAEVAVRAVGGIAQKYRESRQGSDARQKADEFWQASVVDRVRCKTHHTPYTIKELRNGLRKDGSFYRRYVGICQGGQESRSFDFDLDALNQLSRTGGIQNLPPRLPTPASRQAGVDQ